MSRAAKRGQAAAVRQPAELGQAAAASRTAGVTRQGPADQTGLAAALAAEHAAVYAYGVIGVQLDEEQAEAAREAEAVHRDRRDSLLLTLTARGLDPPPAQAAYQLPFPVSGAQAARELAVLIEERLAASWRAVLPAVAAEDRARALEALVDAAVRATGWRLAAAVTPATTPFPGRP